MPLQSQKRSVQSDPVEVGCRYKGRAAILSGLAAGEHVVVEGHQKVMAPGTTVFAAPESTRYGVTPGPLGTQDSTPDTRPPPSSADEPSHADL